MSVLTVVMWIYAIGVIATYLLLVNKRSSLTITDPRLLALGLLAKPTFFLLLSLAWPLLVISIRSFRVTKKEPEEKDKQSDS